MNYVANETNIDFLLEQILSADDQPQFIVIDLFCGAGGTTTGIDMAIQKGLKVAKVIACVNHDHKAIKSHWWNHPDVIHFEEDIRTLNLAPLVRIADHYRTLYPDALLILWASLECTNFSKAKGGLPRDADSRTLADDLKRYIDALRPDYIQIENVVEFMSWGPLDDRGKPVSRRNGEDWLRWRREICERGYADDWRELNSADFGAYTSRNRLFGIFGRPGLPIIWPEATHAKKTVKGSLFNNSLQPWKPVKDVLDFADEGQSIFNRKKPLSDKTLERIFAGLVKYVAKGDKAFLSKYFSGKPKAKVTSINKPSPTVTTFGGGALVQTIGLSHLSVEQPAGTITTKDHHALVQAQFIVQRNGGAPDGRLVDVIGPSRTLTSTGGNQELVQPQFLLQTYAANSQSDNTFPVDKPARTITTRDATQLVQPEFLTCYYSNGGEVHSPENPSPTLPTKDRISLVQPQFFIDKHFGAAQNQSIEDPAGTVMPNDKHRLVEAVPYIMPTNYNNQPKSIDEPCPTITANRKYHYLVNPAWGGNPGSVENPCCVVVARQDKAPLYLVQVEGGEVAVPIYDEDSPIAIQVKQFMALYGLVDIKMRMLRVVELLSIQGFPQGYRLDGNQADQKKFIGNSVVPVVVKAWYEALFSKTILNKAA